MKEGVFSTMRNLKTILLHVLWLAAAVMLVVSGIGILCDSSNIMTTVANWIGIVMILSGLMQLGVTVLMRATIFGDRAFFTKGMMTLLIGVIILLKPIIASTILWVLLSVMVLVDGISLASAALAMRKDGIRGRQGLLAAGVLEAVLGVCCLLNPDIVGLAVGIIIGVGLIYEGLALAGTWFVGMKWRGLL